MRCRKQRPCRYRIDKLLIPEHSEITYQNPSDRFPFHIRFPCDQFLAVDRDSAYDRSDQCDRSENDGADGPCPLLADPCSLDKSDDDHRTCSTEPRSDIDENPAERTQCISLLVILCQLSTQRKERNDEKRITKPETTADDQIPYKLECNTVGIGMTVYIKISVMYSRIAP